VIGALHEARQLCRCVSCGVCEPGPTGGDESARVGGRARGRVTRKCLTRSSALALAAIAPNIRR
jgi:hypothetical protein